MARPSHVAKDCAHPVCRHHIANLGSEFCDGSACGFRQMHATRWCAESRNHDLIPLERTVESMLDEAKKLVRGDRQRDYQPPAINFDRIIRGWSVIFGQEVTVEQMTLAMIWLKMAREVGTPKRDNWVDIAGYVEAYDWAKQEMTDE